MPEATPAGPLVVFGFDFGRRRIGIASGDTLTGGARALETVCSDGRGPDWERIGALIERWKAQGMAIVVITSELPELLLLADRILVMHRGHVVKEMPRAEATAERVVHAAMNA